MRRERRIGRFSRVKRALLRSAWGERGGRPKLWMLAWASGGAKGEEAPYQVRQRNTAWRFCSQSAYLFFGRDAPLVQALGFGGTGGE